MGDNVVGSVRTVLAGSKTADTAPQYIRLSYSTVGVRLMLGAAGENVASAADRTLAARLHVHRRFANNKGVQKAVGDEAVQWLELADGPMASAVRGDVLHSAFPVVAKYLCPGKPVNATYALQAYKNALAVAEHVFGRDDPAVKGLKAMWPQVQRELQDAMTLTTVDRVLDVLTQVATHAQEDVLLAFQSNPYTDTTLPADDRRLIARALEHDALNNWSHGWHRSCVAATAAVVARGTGSSAARGRDAASGGSGSGSGGGGIGGSGEGSAAGGGASASKVGAERHGTARGGGAGGGGGGSRDDQDVGRTRTVTFNDAPPTYGQQVGTMTCKQFAVGLCRRGSACRFSHDPPK
jgi:hypothetical protein